jgi:hypothetical protein
MRIMPINSFENYPMSWKPSIDKTKKPIYQALAGQLEQDILNGVLLPGTKLPSQRELADYLDLNLSTISKAFKVCDAIYKTENWSHLWSQLGHELDVFIFY